MQEKFRTDMEFRIAEMAKEQEFLRIQSYARQRVAEEIANATIMSELAEYITGESEAEIEASIGRAQEKTASIVQGAQSMFSSGPVGVSPSGGPSGIMDGISGPRQYSREEVERMPMKDYAVYRVQQGIDRAGSGRGLLN
jgi:hypothetical protein